MIIKIEQDTNGPQIKLENENEAEYYQLSAMHKVIVEMKLKSYKDCDGKKVELTMFLKE